MAAFGMGGYLSAQVMNGPQHILLNKYLSPLYIILVYSQRVISPYLFTKTIIRPRTDEDPLNQLTAKLWDCMGLGHAFPPPAIQSNYSRMV